METYDAMRAFADSWGLLGMVIVFLIAVFMAYRPGGAKGAQEAAQIPFNETPPNAPAAAAGDKADD